MCRQQEQAPNKGIYKGKVKIHIAEPQSNKCKQEQRNTFFSKNKMYRVILEKSNYSEAFMKIK